MDRYDPPSLFEADHRDDLPAVPPLQPAPPGATLPGAADIPVKVVRSPRRRRTVEARMVNGVLEVLIPARATASDEQHYVELMRSRTRHQRGHNDLVERTADLARRHGLPAPASIRWVTNMDHRWGSCTPADSAIRISHRLQSVPSWVLDAVIVHEMAHLSVADHSARFWALANRYPKMERARGYLLALQNRPGSDDWDE